MSDFHSYDPGRLGLGADEAFARDAWALLNSPECVGAMLNATSLGRPAVVGVLEPLLERFGDQMESERNRQRVGHMIRQIVERHGCEVDQMDVKVQAFPFTKATRYRMKDHFVLHVFRAASDAKELCVCARRTGAALPDAPGQGRWMYWTELNTPLQATIALGVRDIPGLRQEIARTGYMRARRERMMRAAG